MRSFLVHPAPQGSPEWLTARVGLVTASRAGDVLARLKGGGEAAARRDYRMELVCERLTGISASADTYVSADMQRGTECEPAARDAYEAHTGRLVSQVGLLVHPSLPVGGSPDGVVGDVEGLIEIKVPRPATHLRYLRAGGVPSDYLGQVRHLLWLTGAAWCDFVSFCPAMPAHLQLYVSRLTAGGAGLDDYAAQVADFLDGVDREVAALTPITEALTASCAAVKE